MIINFRVFTNFDVRELLLIYPIEFIFFSWFLTKNISLNSSYLTNLNYFFLDLITHPYLIIHFFERLLMFFGWPHFNSSRWLDFIYNNYFFRITFIQITIISWFSGDYLIFLSQKMTRNYSKSLILIFGAICHQNIYL